MSRMLEMPDALYTALERAAEASGMTPVGWIAAHVAKTNATVQVGPGPDGSPATLADLFAGRIGRIAGGGQGRLSEDVGNKFTDYLEAKKRAGHL